MGEQERGDPYQPPLQGDSIDCGAVVIRVGRSNGDFRAIRIVDYQERLLAEGNVPYSALDEIETEAVQIERQLEELRAAANVTVERLRGAEAALGLDGDSWQAKALAQIADDLERVTSK